MATLAHALGGWWAILVLLLGGSGTVLAARKVRSKRERGVVAPVRRALGLGLKYQLLRLFRLPEDMRNRAMEEEFDDPVQQAAVKTTRRLEPAGRRRPPPSGA